LGVPQSRKEEKRKMKSTKQEKDAKKREPSTKGTPRTGKGGKFSGNPTRSQTRGAERLQDSASS